ncbi:MAG: DUF3598 domain-containing protein [Gammaproteobacteria bacterium]
MNIIAETQAIVADQQGVWEGEYVHLDEKHNEIDRHKSRLVCRLHDGPEGEAKLSQTNIYTWPDQQQEIRFFEGTYKKDRIWIDNELINGWTGAIELDATNRTIMVGWTRAAEPDFRYYEMITVSEDGNAKNRTWHWYRKGRLFQRTLINEQRVSRDWKAHDDPSYYQFRVKAPIK